MARRCHQAARIRAWSRAWPPFNRSVRLASFLDQPKSSIDDSKLRRHVKQGKLVGLREGSYRLRWGGCQNTAVASSSGSSCPSDWLHPPNGLAADHRPPATFACPRLRKQTTVLSTGESVTWLSMHALDGRGWAENTVSVQRIDAAKGI